MNLSGGVLECETPFVLRVFNAVFLAQCYTSSLENVHFGATILPSLSTCSTFCSAEKVCLVTCRMTLASVMEKISSVGAFGLLSNCSLLEEKQKELQCLKDPLRC